MRPRACVSGRTINWHSEGYVVEQVVQAELDAGRRQDRPGGIGPSDSSLPSSFSLSGLDALQPVLDLDRHGSVPTAEGRCLTDAAVASRTPPPLRSPRRAGLAPPPRRPTAGPAPWLQRGVLLHHDAVAGAGQPCRSLRASATRRCDTPRPPCLRRARRPPGRRPWGGPSVSRTDRGRSWRRASRASRSVAMTVTK